MSDKYLVLIVSDEFSEIYKVPMTEIGGKNPPLDCYKEDAWSEPENREEPDGEGHGDVFYQLLVACFGKDYELKSDVRLLDDCDLVKEGIVHTLVIQGRILKFDQYRVDVAELQNDSPKLDQEEAEMIANHRK